ncbi:hypothetical protein B0J11DRAFT_123578 [Dendryphion nanum]|uniref:Uncharacterized protein n=1 Tax=Dendryphion nanum TaxID=256645 RepID=A0A9P9D9B7_9PLEO|nr:hypothetical protein B0J11DRAFT_123578 [Dendryphion nanum]
MEDTANNENIHQTSKRSKFTFKSKAKARSSKRDHSDDESEIKNADEPHKRNSSRGRYGSKRSHPSSKRKRSDRSARTIYEHTFTRNGDYDNPDHKNRESLYDGLTEEDHRFYADDGGDTDHAFRESLFDALADDEGASYWEGVYGQPVHVYPNTKSGPNGKLERMSDEEYAEYVRGKMWEKSHQHIVEEREAREKERKRRKENKQGLDEEAAREEAEREEIRQKMTESLKRGKERQKAREVGAAWETYKKKWEDLKGYSNLAQETEAKALELIPWPVVSGKRRDVSKEEIEYFFENSSAWKDDATAVLKGERVRWHPDKMQQRFGQHINPLTMQSVTAVFQVVDRLWSQRRNRN